MAFGHGMVVREPIVDLDDEARRLVWTAIVPSVTHYSVTHYSGSADVFPNPDGGAKVVWIADLLPNEAANTVGLMMDEGVVAWKTCLDGLTGNGVEAALRATLQQVGFKADTRRIEISLQPSSGDFIMSLALSDL